MTERTTRRRLLASSAAVGVAVVAGCADDGEVGGDPVHETEPDEEPVGEEDDEGELPDEPAEDVDHENPDGEVRFVEPEDGDEVESPVEVRMEVEDFEVRPAEERIEDGYGHLHVIIDEGCVEPTEPIPEEEGYIHYSEGELEDELELEPGEYELCLQASDGAHVAYDMTDEIAIEVVGGEDGDEADEEDDEDENGNGEDENGNDEDEDENGE